MLNETSRLLQVEFSAVPLPTNIPNVHFVVRPISPNGSIGPPIFAHPPFNLPSPMFCSVLGGLTIPPTDP